ncbi:MAG: hypothetical protein DDT35_01566 [Firmicutes bacterium]|nr:hypothetical protein [Bacillota bacterium]
MEGKGLKTMVDNAQREFWMALEADFFLLLGAVADTGLSDVAPRKAWEHAIRKAGWIIFESWLMQLDSNAEALQRQVEARNYFAIQTERILRGGT